MRITRLHKLIIAFAVFFLAYFYVVLVNPKVVSYQWLQVVKVPEFSFLLIPSAETGGASILPPSL